MKKRFAGFALIVLTAVGLCGLSACTSTSGSAASAGNVPDANVLRVGLASGLPPFVLKSRKEFSGVEPDLARALAADMGKRVQFVEVRWDGLVDALLDNKVDIIMSGMTITRQRLMRVNFTKPYLRSGQTVLVRRPDVNRMRLAMFDRGTKVGAQRATTGDFFVQQNCPQAQRKVFATAEQGAKALLSGQIDAFVCDGPVNWWLASENEAAGLTVMGGYLTEEYLAWAVRKNDADLLQAANRFIEKGQQNGRISTIVRNWIPQL